MTDMGSNMIGIVYSFIFFLQRCVLVVNYKCTIHTISDCNLIVHDRGSDLISVLYWVFAKRAVQMVTWKRNTEGIRKTFSIRIRLQYGTLSSRV